MGNPFHERTERKLNYAALHLCKIVCRVELSSADDFEVAHEERVESQ